MIYDVLIVGAGVTGGILARELSRSKVSVCLLVWNLSDTELLRAALS